ncbi:FtsX-like permease family protein [Dactylosporangium sp. AC04546]|uniref:ABC transporter permease n=1 Tax=Dactylosporangium sp. AC04546 TaxID=2862460 RepID=UPI001EDF1FC4|nr:FtsX-like permease family protein [Dactylosporangium sp. AC04546]WVK84780.1 FtsX-like permease family protein [Dactylosporangium sp. AC04546]
MILAKEMVRHRWASFLGTFAALAVGVAVISGSLALWASAQPRTPKPLAAAEVLIASPSYDPPEGGFLTYRPWSPEEVDQLVARTGRAPGVAAAIPDRTFYVQRLVDGRPVGNPRDAVHSGRGWASAGLSPYELVQGSAPDRPGGVVVDAALGVPVGGQLPVLTAAGPATWTVTGTIDGPGLYVDEATARSLAGGVTVIGLRLTPGADAERVADGLGLGALGKPLTGAERSAAEPAQDTRTRWLGAQLIIATVLVGGFVAVFVVASTCAFSAAQRRREIGLLRAIGATPGQVRRLLLAEVLLVALGAGVLGAIGGALLAPLLEGPFVAVGLEPAGFRVGLSWWAMAAALVAGLVVAAIGVWLSARRASRVPALDALREAAAEKRPMTLSRWIFGGLGVVVGGGLAALLPGSTAEQKPTIVLGSAMVLLVAAALLAPAVVVPVVRLVSWPFRRSATGMLVREGTAVAARRVASTAAPVLAAVGFAVLLVGTFQTANEAVGIEDTAKIPERAVAAPAAAPGLSEAAVQAQRGRSELSSVVYLASGEPIRATGAAEVDGLVAAPSLGWRVGESVPLRFVDGTVRSVAVAQVSDEVFIDTVMLPRALVRAHDPTALTEVVYLAGPFTPAAGAEELTARAYVEREAAEEGDLIDLFLAVLLGISVGYTGLAVANTLLMATYGRRQEFVTLHRTGATTGQTLRVVVVEALVAVGVGTLLGLAVAVPALFEARAGLAEEIGADVTLVMPWGTLAAVVGVCGALAVAASAVPFLRRGGRWG